MPPSRTTRRQFPPLSLRCRFSPDHNINFPPLSLREIFAIDRVEGTNTETGLEQTANNPERVKKPRKTLVWSRALQRELGISEDINTRMMEVIQPLVTRTLNPKMSFGKQNSKHIDNICAQIHRNHPILAYYEDDWVCKLAIKSEFKAQKSYSMCIRIPTDTTRLLAVLSELASLSLFMLAIQRALSILQDPLHYAAQTSQENAYSIKAAITSLVCPTYGRKRKARNELSNNRAKRARAERLSSEGPPILTKFPDELLLLVCEELTDDDLLALMLASWDLIPSAGQIFRARLEERGTIQHFLGTPRMHLRAAEMNNTLITFLVKFSAPTQCGARLRLLDSLTSQSGPEINLLQHIHCMPAMQCFWEAVEPLQLDTVELKCDERDAPERDLGVLPQPAVPVLLHDHAPIRVHCIEVSSIFTQVRRRIASVILQPLLHNDFASMLWIHIHPQYRAFGWSHVQMPSLYSLWITSCFHFRIPSLFYKSNPALSSVSTVAPYSSSTNPLQTPVRASAGANVVQPGLRQLSTSPRVLWKLKGMSALESLRISAEEPWSWEEFWSEDSDKVRSFCAKIRDMASVFGGIPASRVTEARVSFQLPRGANRHRSMVEKEGGTCSCSLGAEGTHLLSSVAFEVDDITDSVYDFVTTLLVEFTSARKIEISGFTCSTTVDQEMKFVEGVRKSLQMVESVKAHHGTWIIEEGVVNLR
ncbi:hypothetical protein NP233_g2479 [Leucocoprinus birnbaumii]|uniref:Uncharacterized protein n=1 Tax=Leucocoprinus birnbaumii TaxID=56174 RepID=A0AAD5YTQ5_9AGAR|nr:hypothetical protein NP233_g2479 [Leucocoprinus birnbaumii]